MSARIPIPEPSPDGLETREVGAWAEEKYRIVWLYDTLFSSGMKNKWDTRVYIDLYSGSGVAAVKGTSKLVFGSPLLTLQVKDPFDRYIFCEEETILLDSLKLRAGRIAPNADIRFILGNCDDQVRKIKASVPVASKTNTVLSLCFVDPFDLGISFETLATLGEQFTDFLVLLALHMDANRNVSNYVNESSTKVDRFLGNSGWRSRWTGAQSKGDSFPQFLSAEFSKSMQSINYLPPPPMKMIRLAERNVPLYKLAIFSRNTRAYEFWQEVLKYSSDQLGFTF
jgi:three-Cys-motif partner protein